MAQSNPPDSDAEARERALHRARELRSFYSHAIVFVLAISWLFLIDLLTGDGWWFYWPLFGWGIVVALHAISTFGQVGPFSGDWEERKADEILRRERDRDAR